MADRHRAVVIPTKAIRTQQDNAKELKQLLACFDDPPCPLESIEPQDVNQYVQWRPHQVLGMKTLAEAYALAA